MPVVTTVMPVYNGEPHLAEALQSLAQQTRRPDRVVVLDNCSTDRTREIVTGFKGLPCEYRLNERNLGLFGNHNRALELAAQTDYLHFLHADDMLLPTFCARMLELLTPREGRWLAWASAERINEKGQPMPALVPLVSGPPQPFKLDEFIKHRARLWPDIYVSGTMLKTNCKPLPCRFREDFKQAGDHFFWAELASHCAGRLQVREMLLQYRDHPLSASAANQTQLDISVDEHWKVIQETEALRGKRGLEHWLRMHKLGCFFAAFIHVQMQAIQSRSPEYARALSRAGRHQAGLLHWWLGKAAFYLREGRRALRGRPNPQQEHVR